ncbi:unnamed protein product [Gadus morhua 'NCC']
MTTGALDLPGLITASVIVSMRATSPVDRRQLLILETMAPGVLAASIVDRDEARGDLLALMNNPMLLKTQTWWITFTASHPDVPWASATGVWTDVGDLHVMLRWVHLAANSSAEVIRERVLYVVVLTMISFSMRRHIRGGSYKPWQIQSTGGHCYVRQWDAAVLALRTVAANPHYGFKTNLEHVNSSNYSSDAWLCGRLLIRAGDETLSGYKGFRPDTPRTKVVEDMITQHLSEGVDNVDLSSPFTPAETGGLLALIDVAAIHCA